MGGYLPVQSASLDKHRLRSARSRLPDSSEMHTVIGFAFGFSPTLTLNNDGARGLGAERRAPPQLIRLASLQRGRTQDTLLSRLRLQDGVTEASSRSNNGVEVGLSHSTERNITLSIMWSGPR
jgi:hypothetical protein